MYQVGQQDKLNITQEYNDFKEQLKQRQEIVPLSVLGENEQALNYVNTIKGDTFKLGAEKEATRMLILLHFMEKENLLDNPGLVVSVFFF